MVTAIEADAVVSGRVGNALADSADGELAERTSRRPERRAPFEQNGSCSTCVSRLGPAHSADPTPSVIRHTAPDGRTRQRFYAVGQIVDCDDPIAAYIATNTLVNRYLAADPAIADQFRKHLRSAEPALHRARLAAARA